MLRIVLTVGLLILSQAASAYPASPACTYTGTTVAGTFSTLSDLTTAISAQHAPSEFVDWCTGTTGPTCGGPGPQCTDPVGPDSGRNYRICNFSTSSCNVPGSASANPSGGSCPNGGTLSGSLCNCPPGETDTGTACVTSPCPAAGTELGAQNITVGWALSPTVGAADIVGGSVNWPAIYGANHCVQDGGNLCGATVSNVTPISSGEHCWRAQSPTDQGMYRISCDIPMTAAGSGCPTSSGTPSSATAGGPSCPTGNVGDVNGKPVCLGTIPTAGINFGGTPAAGNPRAGTSPTDQNNGQREPDSGSGGGPDARGGPGVTTGPGGTGTGNNRTGGNNNGEAQKIELPTDYNREPTQQSILAELKKARKIDETGTPDGSGADTDAKAALDSEAGKLQTGLDGIISGSGAPDRSWGFSISFPSTCNPFVVGTANWGFFNVDFCDFQDVAHDLMTLVWLGVTIFACVGMVFRAVNAG